MGTDCSRARDATPIPDASIPASRTNPCDRPGQTRTSTRIRRWQGGEMPNTTKPPQQVRVAQISNHLQKARTRAREQKTLLSRAGSHPRRAIRPRAAPSRSFAAEYHADGPEG